MNKKETVSLAFLTDGGAGNLFVQLNFIYCVYLYLQDEAPQIIVFGHKSAELNQLLMEKASFIKEYYPPTESNRGYDYDAFIHLEFFPDVLSEKPGLKCKSEKVYKLLGIWKTFMSDAQRRYAIMHPVVNYNAYIYALNHFRMVLDSLDMDGRIGVGKDYKWKLVLEEGDGYLKTLGIERWEYITIQRGATPGSFQRESTKLWPVRYYEKLIDLLKTLYPGKKIVQVGERKNSVVLSGADLNLLGKTTWRELGILLRDSWLHIDGECGMVHFRRMLTNQPSVVLFGPTPMEFYGYEGNINIRSNVCKKWCARLANSWSERCIRGYEEAPCMASLLPGTVAEEIAAWDFLSSARDKKEQSCFFKNTELYADEGIWLDADHKRDFLDTYKVIHYERTRMEIGQLKVFCVQEEGSSFIPLKDTAAYQALAEPSGWDVYNSYVRLLREKDYNRIHSPERFRKLVNRLDEDGYSGSMPILVDADNRILDGQHRAAWLAARFGLSCQAEMVRIYRLGGENWEIFPFERIPRGSRVVIYGSGAIGESYIKQIDYTGYCEIKALLDRNADSWNLMDRKRKRMECSDPSGIKRLEGMYDYVVIASRGGKNMRDMKNTLLAAGVPDDRIVSYANDVQQIAVWKKN